MPYPAKPTSKRDMIKLRINEQQAREREQAAIKEAKDKEDRKKSAIMDSVFTNRENQTSRYRKYTAFTEQAKDKLLEHAIFTLASKALQKVDENQGTHLMENSNNITALHSMIYQFIHESGGSSAVLAEMRMHGRTYYLTETYKLIEGTFKKIVESVDKDNPDSFQISGEITDGFKNAINSEDTDIMSEAISDRVVAAISQFIEDNAKDKEAIVAALTATKDKIDSMEDENKAIEESYSRLGKRYITEVRARKHGLFNEMVNLIAKDIIKNKELHESYMNGASIDVGKIVDKVTVMYGFLETVNTMRLAKVTPEFIKTRIFDM